LGSVLIIAGRRSPKLTARKEEPANCGERLN
jgi:hypothetical protein